MHENKIITLVVEKEFLEVGRNTVRAAVRILVSRNIVTVRQGSGTFISEKQGAADCKLRTQQCHVQSGSSNQPGCIHFCERSKKHRIQTDTDLSQSNFSCDSESSAGRSGTCDAISSVV